MSRRRDSGSSAAGVSAGRGKRGSTGGMRSRVRDAVRLASLEALESRTLFAAITGTVFLDANANGLRDNNEPGLSNWRVYLDANGNNAHDEGEQSAITNAEGR